MTIDWKRKLSSRKFWAAVVEFVSGMLYTFGMAESEIGQICGLIMSGAGLIAYILAEGWVDANRTET